MAIGLDAFGVTFLARDLKDLLSGQVIVAVSPGELKILNVHLSGKRPAVLRFLAEPNLPLMCVEMPGRTEAAALHMSRFEAHLKGATISDVCQTDLDRVIMMTAKRGDEAFHVYFELIPPFPNAYLTDARDNVLAVLFRAGTKTRRRVLEHGKTYIHPKAPGKMHPFDVTPELMETLSQRGDPEILAKTVLGAGPFLSREVMARGCKTGSTFKAWSEMIDLYKQGGATATVFSVSPDLTKNPPYLGLAWFRPVQEGVTGPRSAKSFNAAASMLVAESLRTTRLERERAALLGALRREIKKWERICHSAGQPESRREEARDLRKIGEIMIANLSRIKRGASEARLRDIHSEKPRQVVVRLDPGLPPHANADRYFKMAKKAFRRAEKDEERLKVARSRLPELTSFKNEVASPEITEERMAKIAGLIAESGDAARATRLPVDERAERLGLKLRKYAVAGGWVVLVGKSARDNDTLTHKYASPGDLWFHARQAQGSHVVLRKEKKKAEVSKQAILEAAAVAAYYSKARTSKHVPVSYTEKRYVRKARKGPAGLALMLREKVVFVDPALPVER